MKRGLYHRAGGKAIARASQRPDKRLMASMSHGHLHPTILETERLRLEPVAEADADAMFALMGDPEVMAYWDSPEIADPDVVAEIVQGQVDDMSKGKAIYWGIRGLTGDGFIGACDLSEIDHRHKRAEVGFMLGREAWGQGYALEAMRAVIAFAAAGGLRRLLARTHLGNRRSDSLLEKLGFEEEGLLRGYVLRDGEHRDCRLFGILL